MTRIASHDFFPRMARMFYLACEAIFKTVKSLINFEILE
jgi:hypothetical protein